MLVVDDEESLRRVLERALGRYGYRVEGAASAEIALDMIARERPQAVLVDVHLPTMSGLAFYVTLSARWPELVGCVAVMTGDAETDDVRAWIARNDCPLIGKPFNLSQIQAWLGVVMEWRERRTEQA